MCPESKGVMFGHKMKQDLSRKCSAWNDFEKIFGCEKTLGQKKNGPENFLV